MTLVKCSSCGATQMPGETCIACGTVLEGGVQSPAPRRPARGQEVGTGGSARWREVAGFGITRQKPFCIKIGMVVSFVAGAFCLLMTFLIFGAGPSATFSVNGQQVTREYFTSVALPPIILTGSIFLAIWYGFWRERPWSRHLVMVFWLLPMVLILAVSPDGLAIGELMINAAIAGWYFYFKRNVVDYYQALATPH